MPTPQPIARPPQREPRRVPTTDELNSSLKTAQQLPKARATVTAPMLGAAPAVPAWVLLTCSSSPAAAQSLCRARLRLLLDCHCKQHRQRSSTAQLYCVSPMHPRCGNMTGQRAASPLPTHHDPGTCEAKLGLGSLTTTKVQNGEHIRPSTKLPVPVWAALMLLCLKLPTHPQLDPSTMPYSCTANTEPPQTGA